MKKFLLLCLLAFCIDISNAQIFGSLASDDYDAAVFLQSASIAATNYKDAVNRLTKDLKADGFWNKHYAIFPLIGGNANAHSYNLKNVNQYRITFGGSPIHDNYGVDFNGSSQYGLFPLNPYSTLDLNSHGLSFYTNEDVAGAGQTYDMGCRDYNTTPYSYLIPNADVGSSNALFYSGNANATASATNTTNKIGLYTLSRTSSSSLSGYKNGTLMVNRTDYTNTTPLPNSSQMAIGGFADGNFVFNYSYRRFAFASVHSGFSSSEAALYYNIILRYETALGRN
jgi:hypothetical protein